MAPVEKKQASVIPAEVSRKLPTKEQWQYIEAELSGLFGQVQLLVDGYHLTIVRTKTGKNKLGSLVYINGSIKGEWFKSHRLSDESPDLPEETRRFHRPCVRALYPAAKVASFEKRFGKRMTQKYGYHEKLVHYSPEWPSAAALRRHLLKHNNNIELLLEDNHAYKKCSL